MSHSPRRSSAASSSPASAEIVEFLPQLPSAGAPRRKRRLVLIGDGYAHWQVLDGWRRKPIRGVELTLIAPYPHAVHETLLPAALAGLIPEDDIRIDLARLAGHCGAEFVIDRVTGIDLETQTLELAHFEERSFDVASIDVGAAAAREDLCQTHRTLVAPRPLPTFFSRFRRRLEELLAQRQQAASSEPLQLAVIGGDAGGVELALCLEERAHHEGWNAEVRLIHGGPVILPGHSPGALQRIEKLLRHRGIAVQLGSEVVDCREDGPAELMLENGKTVPVDLAIWSAGMAPPMFLRGYPLPKSEAGYLAVRPTLQSTADVPVFAAGDVAALGARRSPAGPFHALRQGAVLWENLRQWFRAGVPIEYSPRVETAPVLCCGDGTGIMEYRGWSLRARWPWTRKQRRELNFLHRFQ